MAGTGAGSPAFSRSGVCPREKPQKGDFMELRTRILPKMINSEVEAYLEHNDIIIVPVGVSTAL